MMKKEMPPGAEKGAEGNNPAVHVTGMEPEKKEKSNGKNAVGNAAEREAGDWDAISGSGKRTGDRGKSNVHNRDISSKTVFRNPVLCAQLLRDNCDIPALKNVRPEEIEDISERYIPYLGKELESDSVKKIRILDIGGGKKTEGEGDKEPHFLVSLIDHKSLVDYDVSMQLLRYMMCIWTEYRREMETERGHVLDVIVKVIESLCFKIDVPEEERTQCVQKVRAREMGYLFENMEHMSLREERRKTEEARQRAEEERRRAEEAEEKLRIAEETIKQLLAKENR